MAEVLGVEVDLSAAKEALELWRKPFDTTTGLLSDQYEYYEGYFWNYSFRLLPDMASRIALSGSKDGFVKQLDAFFGFGDVEILQQPGVNPDQAFMDHGYNAHRFEALTNEPDMEAPYAYIWAGRHDRTAAVIQAVRQHMFTTGRGGLPGDDSGGKCMVCLECAGLVPSYRTGTGLNRYSDVTALVRAYGWGDSRNSNSCTCARSAVCACRAVERRTNRPCVAPCG